MRYENDARIREEQRRKYEAKKRRRKKRRRQQMIVRGLLALTIVAFLTVAVVGAFMVIKQKIAENEVPVTADVIKYVDQQPDFRVELLDMNEYSRPGTALEQVNGIVVHYTANPGTTAEQNRGYFEGLKDSGDTYASSHFIIGMEGEIIQCIPCNEISYASNDRNVDTISIECCIPDDTGKFNDATYDSLVKMVTWLMGRYNLTVDKVIRHYDVTGKNCPKYYVENQWAWDQFKEDLLAYIDSNGIAKEQEIQ